MLRRTPNRGTPKHNILTKNHSQRLLAQKFAANTKLSIHQPKGWLFIEASVLINTLAVMLFAVSANAATFPLPVVAPPAVVLPAGQVTNAHQPAVATVPAQPVPPPAPPPEPVVAPPPPELPPAVDVPSPPPPIVSAPGTNYPWADASFYADSSDPWGMYKRQCTSYVAWKVASSNRPMPNWGGHGNANLWDLNAAADGIPVDDLPRVGDAAVSHGGAYGHVMYVEAVNGDGTISISQYNASYTGTYSEAVISPAGLSFIHF